MTLEELQLVIDVDTSQLKSAQNEVKNMTSIINNQAGNIKNIFSGLSKSLPSLEIGKMLFKDDFKNTQNEIKNVTSKFTDQVGNIKNIFLGLSEFLPSLGIGKIFGTTLSSIIGSIGSENLLGTVLGGMTDEIVNWSGGLQGSVEGLNFELFAGALEILNPVLEVFRDLGTWLWEGFLQPIAEWRADMMVETLTSLADILTIIGDWLSNHKGLIETLLIIVGSFAIALAIVKTAMELHTLAMAAYEAISWLCTYGTTALGVAFLNMNLPIVIAVAAIGSIIAIGVLLCRNWDQIKEAAFRVFGAIGDFIGNICDNIGSFFKGLINILIGGLNFMINGLNKLNFDIPDWIPGIGGKNFGFNIPNIPYLAKGGIINSATLAVVGERGREAVMPLENNTGWITDLADKVTLRMSQGTSNSNYDRPIEFVLKVGDSNFARIVVDSLNKLFQQEGKILLDL